MNAEERSGLDPALVADGLRRRIDALPNDGALGIAVTTGDLLALLDERAAIESAVTDYADSTESGAGLPDLVAAMWRRVVWLSEREPATPVPLPFELPQTDARDDRVRVAAADGVVILEFLRNLAVSAEGDLTPDEADALADALRSAATQARQQERGQS